MVLEALEVAMNTTRDGLISPPVQSRQVLKREGVEFVVAPYEADAQLAFLALSGDVAAVITEDSDLLAYGCPKACPLPLHFDLDITAEVLLPDTSLVARPQA